MDGFAIPPDLSRRLVPVDAAVPSMPPLRLAAVIALLLREGETTSDDPHPGPRLVLIERSNRLRAHAGQIAFPGGKPEPHDASLLETACREAREEVGLCGEPLRVLGRLTPVPTPTGFLIVPFVAWAPEAWRPCATSPEVARVLTPSLARLSDPALHRVTGRVQWQGNHYDMHEYAIHDPPLWGATARMVRELLEHVGKR